jgi:hypothetical protein
MIDGLRRFSVTVVSIFVKWGDHWVFLIRQFTNDVVPILLITQHVIHQINYTFGMRGKIHMGQCIEFLSGSRTHRHIREAVDNIDGDHVAVVESDALFSSTLYRTVVDKVPIGLNLGSRVGCPVHAMVGILFQKDHKRTFLGNGLGISIDHCQPTHLMIIDARHINLSAVISDMHSCVTTKYATIRTSIN